MPKPLETQCRTSLRGDFLHIAYPKRWEVFKRKGDSFDRVASGTCKSMKDGLGQAWGASELRPRRIAVMNSTVHLVEQGKGRKGPEERGKKMSGAYDPLVILRLRVENFVLRYVATPVLRRATRWVARVADRHTK